MDLTQTSSPATAARPGMAGLTQLQQHPLFRQLLVMVSIAASVALGVAVVLWSQSPSYALLYGNLGEGGAQEVRDACRSRRRLPRGRDHRRAAGAVAQAARRRMTLAAQGCRAPTVSASMLQKDSALAPAGWSSRPVTIARWRRAGPHHRHAERRREARVHSRSEAVGVRAQARAASASVVLSSMRAAASIVHRSRPWCTWWRRACPSSRPTT